jgi:hypothetical protein
MTGAKAVTSGSSITYVMLKRFAIRKHAVPSQGWLAEAFLIGVNYGCPD